MARILIVEDETPVLMLAEAILQEAGHETLSANTVAEAQAVIRSGEKLDLVFADVSLAGHREGGLVVGLMVGKARPRTPVLYTSGRAVSDGMRDMFDAKWSGFLPKPYTARQLTAAIVELWSRWMDT